ncbi:MAG: recombinase family protein [Lachnospiraceae bacterium]|nr:recombinase family protein [Lachnospiraceae bacterium]
MYDAIYTRQSLDKKDSISIESQFSMCEHETHGSKVRKYSDKGFSGKNLNRPDFERLREDIINGLIKRVIVYKLDRISRSILDFSNLMIFFEEHGVEFVSTTEKFDTSTPVGRAMLNICIVFAQLERETIQQRVSDAYHSRSQKGFFMGGHLPYGFKKEATAIDGKKTSMYVAHEEEASHVKLLYSLYANESYSLGMILSYLVENNIQNPKRKPWTTARISEVLRCPAYVKSDASVYQFFKSQGANVINPPADFDGRGCYLYTGDVSKTKKKSDLKDKVVVIAPHEGFISSDVWLKCRIRCLNNRNSATTCKAKNSWIVGKTKCGNCGYALVIKKSRGKMYSFCSNQLNMRVCKGIGKSLYNGVLEDYISNAIKDKLAKFDELSGETENQANPKIEKNKLRVIEIDNEINGLLSKVANANNILMDYINKKAEELAKKKKELLQENLSMAQMTKKTNMDIVRNHVQNWDKTKMEDKQVIIDIFIKVIHVKKEEIIINWNI